MRGVPGFVTNSIGSVVNTVTGGVRGVYDATVGNLVSNVVGNGELYTVGQNATINVNAMVNN